MSPLGVTDNPPFPIFLKSSAEKALRFIRNFAGKKEHTHDQNFHWRAAGGRAGQGGQGRGQGRAGGRAGQGAGQGRAG